LHGQVTWTPAGAQLRPDPPRPPRPGPPGPPRVLSHEWSLVPPCPSASFCSLVRSLLRSHVAGCGPRMGHCALPSPKCSAPAVAGQGYQPPLVAVTVSIVSFFCVSSASCPPGCASGAWGPTLCRFLGGVEEVGWIARAEARINHKGRRKRELCQLPLQTQVGRTDDKCAATLAMYEVGWTRVNPAKVT